jgi:hypothetical protein
VYVPRLSYTPPALPESLPNRALRRDERFDVAETLGVERATPAFPVRPRIVSTAHGSIDHMLLWYGRSAEGEFGFREIYGELLRSLPPATRLTIVAHPETVSDLGALIASEAGDREIEIVETPPWLAFTVWAEDAFVVIEDLGVDPPITYLLEPERFPRGGDLQIAELIAQASGPVQATQVPLRFQGGNVLIGDDFVLIGRDYLDESIAAALDFGFFDDFPYDDGPEAHEEYTRRIFREAFDPARDLHFLESDPAAPRAPVVTTEPDGRVWLDVVDRGTGERQPIFHIDMFVSLAGQASSDDRYRVLVGDPRLANEMLGWESGPHDLIPEFDEIAAQLDGLGFEVTRTPLPHLYQAIPGARRVEVDGELVDVDGIRLWYHATSNNCLVQIDGAARDVWLPTYGHDELEPLREVDAEHKRIWQGLGFTVHQLGDFNPFAFNLGALHCIKKYIARGGT